MLFRGGNAFWKTVAVALQKLLGGGGGGRHHDCLRLPLLLTTNPQQLEILVTTLSGWWYVIEDECVEFFDGPDEPDFRKQGPPLHHFRSFNIKNEQKYLMTCWGQCIEKGVALPATKARDSNGRWNVSERCLLRNYQQDADREIVQADFEIHDQPADLQIQENIAEAEVLEEKVDLEEDWQNDIEPQSTDSEQQSETTAAVNVNVHVHGHAADPNSVSPETRTEVKLSQHETSCDNEQVEPPPKKSRTEDSQPSSKSGKALALVLG